LFHNSGIDFFGFEERERKGGMNRKRIILMLAVLLALLVLWRALWRAAPVLYLLYPAGILLGALCGWLWFLSFLHWRRSALMLMLAAVLLAYYGLRREHLDLLLLSGIKNFEVRLPADTTARALIGFGFGCILGASAALLINLLVNSWRDGRRPDAR
jgi:hypothetical protein